MHTSCNRKRQHPFFPTHFVLLCSIRNNESLRGFELTKLQTLIENQAFVEVRVWKLKATVHLEAPVLLKDTWSLKAWRFAGYKRSKPRQDELIMVITCRCFSRQCFEFCRHLRAHKISRKCHTRPESTRGSKRGSWAWSGKNFKPRLNTSTKQGTPQVEWCIPRLCWRLWCAADTEEPV